MKKINQRLLDDFVKKNGCGVRVDFKNHNILIPDGGLWSIQKETKKVHKIIGHKRITKGEHKGNYQILFSKKKSQTIDHYVVYIWTEELRETILYFQRLEKVLNKMGVDTKRSLRR